MAYTDAKGAKDKTTAIVGVTAIHGLIGAVLIAGLSGVVTFQPDDPPLVGNETTLPLPPPPPPPEPDEKTAEPTIEPKTPPIYTPPTRVELDRHDLIVTTTTTMPSGDDLVIKTPLPGGDLTLGGATGGTIMPKPKANSVDPIGATPRNAPGSWVTTEDYRAVWINREWTGTARFTVGIDTEGRVKNCEILVSTGHSALDNATCALVTRRARFEPARDAQGKAVSGRYTSAIKWTLPR
ncbi:MAG: energy transducer TonB [Pontixanthobacter sp.]